MGGSARGGFARGSRSPRGCGGRTRHSFIGLLHHLGLDAFCGFVACSFVLDTPAAITFVEPSPRVGCFGSTRGEGSVDAGVVQSLSNGDTDAETVSITLAVTFSSSRSRARRVGLFSYATRAPRRHTWILFVSTPLFISDSSLHFRDVIVIDRIDIDFREHPTKRGMRRG